MTLADVPPIVFPVQINDLSDAVVVAWIIVMGLLVSVPLLMIGSAIRKGNETSQFRLKVDAKRMEIELKQYEIEMEKLEYAKRTIPEISSKDAG